MAKHPRGIVICTRSDARCEQCERFVVDKTRAVLVATAASRSAKKGKIATPIESPRAGKRPVRSGTVIVGGARIVDYQCVPFAFAKFVQGCFVRDELRKEGKDGKDRS
jgi:hypothetical protein